MIVYAQNDCHFESFLFLLYFTFLHHTSIIHRLERLTPHCSDVLIIYILTSTMEDMKQFLKPPVKEQIRLLLVRPICYVTYIRQ